MGLCFGKACSSTDGRSSMIHRKSRASQNPGTSTRIATPGETFQELLARKAEEAFEPGPSSYRRHELPSSSFRNEAWVRCQQQQQRKPQGLKTAMRVRGDEELPVFQTGESSPELTIVESPEFNSPRSDAESFSSFRDGSLGTARSIYEDMDVGAIAVAGSTTPVYAALRQKESNSSSCEIVEETESDSSVTNDIYPRESFTNVIDDRPKEKVILMDSRGSTGQDVLSLEFLEEFCRISEITSQASSCSEADPKEVLVKRETSMNLQDGGVMSSTTHRTRYMSSSVQDAAAEEEGEEEGDGDYKRVELSFVDFLCSQSQAQLSSSPASSNKKRHSTSEGEPMTESMTKKPRFSPEQEVDVEEVNGFMKVLQITSSCSTSEGNSSAGSVGRISFTIPENDIRSTKAPSPLQVPPVEDHPSEQRFIRHSGHRHRHRNPSSDKTPPSTPGSFVSTPFASVGSSFSMEELSFRRSLSPCTPLSASFTSAEALSLEEMTAIWSAFQDGQLVQ